MGEARYKLVYAGDIVPGFEREDVWNNLQALLQADHKTLGQLFSGRPVVVRKNLTADQIRPYEQAMVNSGAACLVLPVNNESFGEDRVQVPVSQAMLDRLLPRMGRVRFAAMLWVVVLVVLAGCWLPEPMMPYLAQHVPGLELWHLATALFSLAGVLILSATVRRLHDISARGWGSLLLFMPVVNCLLLLWLLFASGTRDDNRFGPQPRAAGVIAQPLGLWLPLLAMIALGTYGAINHNELPQLADNLLEAIQAAVFSAGF